MPPTTPMSPTTGPLSCAAAHGGPHDASDVPDPAPSTEPGGGPGGGPAGEPGGEAGAGAVEPAPSLAESLADNWLEDWAENLADAWSDNWTEDEPEPARAPRPVARTAPLLGAGPAVPPTRRVASFAPIRAGGGRHRLPAQVRRRPGPIAAGLMVAVTALAVGSLHGPQPPSADHSAAGVPLPGRTGPGHSYE